MRVLAELESHCHVVESPCCHGKTAYMGRKNKDKREHILLLINVLVIVLFICYYE